MKEVAEPKRHQQMKFKRSSLQEGRVLRAHEESASRNKETSSMSNAANKSSEMKTENWSLD